MSNIELPDWFKKNPKKAIDKFGIFFLIRLQNSLIPYWEVYNHLPRTQLRLIASLNMMKIQNLIFLNTINFLHIILFIAFSEDILSDILRYLDTEPAKYSTTLTQNDLFMAYVGLIFLSINIRSSKKKFKIVILVISATYGIRLFLQLLPAYKRGKDATFNLCVVLWKSSAL